VNELLPFHYIQIIHVNRFPVSEYHDYDCQPNGGLGGGDGHHQKDKDLSGQLLQMDRESDQSKIGAIQHELDRHEYNYGVAPYQDTYDPNCENDCRQA